MSEEQLRLLKMIEEHKITAEEGAKLLSALGDAQAARERAEGTRGRSQARVRHGIEDDLFWGRQVDTERDEALRERDRLIAERDRLREEARHAREEARRQTNEARRQTGRNRSGDTVPLGNPPGVSGGMPQGNPPGVPDASYLRVRVTERETGEVKVDLRLPLGLVNFGLKVGARYLPEHMQLNNEEVLEAVRSGAQGKIVEVNDPKSEAKIEISIES